MEKNTGLRIVGYFIAIIIICLAISKCFNLMNTKSTNENLAGATALGIILIGLGLFIYKKVK